ncbi:terminase small subunit [Pragia fontium]|uniref:terminase small subunit n=1 Tax=Pragia fontium TaxID=82985 RepID=UPI000F70A293|nr:terminase small subunit [Pragia fontium]VEJ54617.1 Terminase small subunit [Pragia fontium]
MAKLNDKQELFCREYIVDLNATQAAIRAGYSEKTAQEQSSRLLSNVMIQSRIAELNADRLERVRIDADYVLNRLVEIDQMDVLDILTDSGDLKPVADWPKAWRTTLSGLEVTAMMGDGDSAALLKKIKWPDKVKNLELLGKHISVQAFKEQVEQKVTATHNIMPVPTCSSADEWEAAAQQQQGEVLGQ